MLNAAPDLKIMILICECGLGFGGGCCAASFAFRISALAGSGMKRVDHECLSRSATVLPPPHASSHTTDLLLFFLRHVYGGRAVFMEPLASISYNSEPILDEDKAGKIM